MTAIVPPRPPDATLSVTKAARMLGVHANTVRAWSDAGRIRYYRINARGDRRYRMSDLQRFLAAAESAAIEGVAGHRGARRSFDPVVVAAALGSSGRGRDGGRTRSERHQDDLSLLDTIARLTLTAGDLDDDLERAAQEIRDAFDQPLVCVWELRGERLVSRAVAVPPGVAPPRLLDLPRGFGILDRALGVPSGTGSRRARHDDRPAVVTATDGGDRG
jgi:excisionase family DNA binding protein